MGALSVARKWRSRTPEKALFRFRNKNGLNVSKSLNFDTLARSLPKMDVGKSIRYRFDHFEADIARSALYEGGVPVPLQEKPFLFLATLLQSNGGVVTRDELSRRLWPDTYVQVNQGLNAAARKVRMALHDDAANPRYLETLGSRGYRFIYPLQIVTADSPGCASCTSAEKKTGLSVHELYLRGRHFWDRQTPPALHKSLYYFQQVLKADPDHALAYAGIADTYNMLATHGMIVPRTGYEHAKKAATKSLELDPGSAEAHVAYSWARLSLDHAWADARRGFERAIEINPEYGFAYNGYAYLLLSSGNVPAGLDAMQRARALEPTSLAMNSTLSSYYYYAREYEKAVELGKAALELDPQFPIAHASLGLAHLATGNKQEALKQFGEAVQFSGEAPLMVAQLAYGLAESGESEKAHELVKQLSHSSNGGVAPAFHIAMAHLALRDRDSAFRWLYRAVDERSHWVLFMHVDPRLDRIREEREFSELSASLQFPVRRAG
jgi:DNA-binding winged helix-turn-helix (wHTH) protein/Tfp pilus assembly protein PilF